MYQAKIEITQAGDEKAIIIEDKSTGNEVMSSRKVQVTKNDLVIAEYPFVTGVAFLTVGNFDKDYALNVKFIGTPSAVIADSVYTHEVEFAMLGYAKKGFTQRKIDLEVDDSIVDKRAHREQSNEVIYYMQVAEDNVQFSNMVGAQTALDYIAEIINAGINSN